VHGKLATAFGELLRKAWSPGLDCEPDKFKQTFGVLKPSFQGGHQEDAQVSQLALTIIVVSNLRLSWSACPNVRDNFKKHAYITLINMICKLVSFPE